MLIRAASGLSSGSVALLSTVDGNGSVIGGIVVFAVGLLVGLASVQMADKMVRTRMHLDYEEWVAAGKPERRAKERRGLNQRRRRDD